MPRRCQQCSYWQRRSVPRGSRTIFLHRARLFSLFGFEVSVHASWLLLAMLIAWTLAGSVFPGITPGLTSAHHWVMAGLATAGLLMSIIFHEMAHSMVARHYGLPIRGITLFIFGGAAEMTAEPQPPSRRTADGGGRSCCQPASCGAGAHAPDLRHLWHEAGSRAGVRDLTATFVEALRACHKMVCRQSFAYNA